MVSKKKKAILISILVGIIVLGIVISGVVFVYYSKETSQPQKQDYSPKPSQNPPLPEEKNDNCPYNEESLTEISSDENNAYMRAQKEELQEWAKIPRHYVIGLWKKGYHWVDIIQLWKWNLSNQEIPDLKTEKRIGVMNCLAVTFNWEGESDWIGLVHRVVVICRKISGGGPKIEVDENQKKSLPMTSDDYAEKLIKYRKEMVNWAGSSKNINLQNYQIFILNSLGADRFHKEKEIAWGRIGGKSAGSALYLAILSALIQKPISAQVSATGAIAEELTKGKINGVEVNLERGTNLPIEGVKEKVEVCVKKGIKRLVLSTYQSSPNLLSIKNKKGKEKVAQDYQELVSSEIKNKMIVYYSKNIKELEELFLAENLT